MYRLTKHRKDRARDVLDKFTRELHDTRRMNVTLLELQLRDLWGMGYQSLKGIMIDILSNHSEYAHLAAFYMEHSGLPDDAGAVVEFQKPLAKLYGVPWYYDKERDPKRAAYWERAFALISQFDLGRDHDGKTILQISSDINQSLVDYFLGNPKELKSMNPHKFEELVAELFHGFGFKVELTRRTRDGGRDIIAVGNEQIVTSKYLIECKRLEKKVGVVPVRSLYGVVNDENATKGILVTTSSFTSPAQEFIKRNEWRLEGKDFDAILEWLKEYQRLKSGISGTLT